MGNLWIQTPTIFIAKKIPHINEPRLFKLPLFKGQLHLKYQVVAEKESVRTMYPDCLVGPWKDLSKHSEAQGTFRDTEWVAHYPWVVCVGERGLPAEVFPPLGLFDSPRDGDNRGNMIARRAALPEVLRNEVGVGEI